ncbi:MAG: hypothetical protein WAV56_00310 [Microgenomates group bacterium]
MKRSWPSGTKEEAMKLRRGGKTYSELVRLLKVPKSTLHYWLMGINRPDEIIKRSKENWLNEVQKLGALANRKKRLERLAALETEVKSGILAVDLSFSSKKTILAMLYWAEGAKGRNAVITFANTDPQMILVFTSLLRHCFSLDESKFRVRLHLHYYHKEGEIKRYWSRLLKIPIEQFSKTYRKKRGTNKTYRRNKYGICFLIYNSLIFKEELMFWARLLADRAVVEANEAKKRL